MAIALDALAYAHRLREVGFTEQQAEGQAEALAAAMTDTLATKQDLSELEARVNTQFVTIRQEVRELETRMDARFAHIDARFVQIDVRFEYLGKHLDTRWAEQTARFDGRLADLERRITSRMVAGIAVVSILVKLL